MYWRNMFKLSQISQLRPHVTVLLLAVSWLSCYLSPLELILDQCWYQYYRPFAQISMNMISINVSGCIKNISTEKILVSLRYHSIGQPWYGNVCNVYLHFHWRFGYKEYLLLLEHSRELDYGSARKPVIKRQTGSLAYTYLLYRGTHTFMSQYIYIYIYTYIHIYLYMYASTWVHTHNARTDVRTIWMTPSYAMPDSPF